ncbi:GntR family transcriptional regulator [Streptomyces chartreusis]|uniref:hypothetical protein n=1 Tax=Streptomyces chartreusis TaxID=1969 RepID=UPI00382DE806
MADLDLAPGTVARAYRELGAAGLIRCRRAAGTRVAALLSEPYAHDSRQLDTLARDFTYAPRAPGADTEDILIAVRNALKARQCCRWLEVCWSVGEGHWRAVRV